MEGEQLKLWTYTKLHYTYYQKIFHPGNKWIDLFMYMSVCVDSTMKNIL